MTKHIFVGFLFLVFFVSECNAFDARAYVVEAANALRVPVDFALRISKMESGTRCGVKNKSSGATGPMQVLPSTARAMGYKNIRNAGCNTQTHAGMKYLAYCMKITKQDRYKAARCYNAGPAGMKSRSKAVHKYAVLAAR